MKFTFNFLLAVLFTIAVVNGQTPNFSFQTIPMQHTGTACSGSVDGTFTVVNSSSTPDTLIWIKSFSVGFPSAWSVSTCDNANCYPAAILTKQFIIPANSSANIVMTLVHSGAAGTGTINLKIAKASDTTVNITSNMMVTLSACTTGINNDFRASDIKFYPLPCKTNLSIQLNGNENVKSVEIYNLIGAQVFKQDIYSSNEDVISVNTSSLPNGCYFISLFDANKRKLVSKRIEKN
ncbi:MAG: hypothetical protein RL065_2226 [Bacteroidota bacterium]|jgi:hypothetical protein